MTCRPTGAASGPPPRHRQGQQPADHHGQARPDERREQREHDVADARPRRDDQDVDEVTRPRNSSGVPSWRIVARTHGREHVGPARHAQADERQRKAHGATRNVVSPNAVMAMPHTVTLGRPRGRRGSRPTPTPRTGRRGTPRPRVTRRGIPGRRDRRGIHPGREPEECGRAHAEDHRDEIDRERPQIGRRRRTKAKPLADRRQSRPRHLRRVVETRGIARTAAIAARKLMTSTTYAPTKSHRGDEDAPDSRPDDGGGLEVELVEGDGGR